MLIQLEEGGLIGKAQLAKTKMEDEKIRENQILDNYAAMIDGKKSEEKDTITITKTQYQELENE